MLKVLEKMNGIVWGVPGLLLILFVGIYFTIRTKFAQLKLLPSAMRSFFQNRSGSGKALFTALAATVGTGNLAGVAGAIAIGGPGAVFWMWVCGFLGMITKFSEATLAVHYRAKNIKGEYIGGPMYVIKRGLHKKWHWMAGAYCFLGLVASFGVGNSTQINTVIVSMRASLNHFGITDTRIAEFAVGISLAILIGVLLAGGGRRVSNVANALVPFAAFSYVVLCVFVLTICASKIPDAFISIFRGAFAPSAVTGGVISSIFISLRTGASRGVFTNEAGMGTAGIAHCSADVSHPVEQGLMGIMEVFIDTILICTLTALVILSSGIQISYGTDPGIRLTNEAFSAACGPWVCVLISVFLCLFAIATVLGWGYYGGRCAQYLFGDDSWKKYVVVQVVVVLVSTILRSEYLWTLAELLNGLMAIPNLITLLLLSPVLRKLLKEYLSDKARKS